MIRAMSQFAFVVNLPFCGSNKVDSFYCDFCRIIKLACTDGPKFEFIVGANSGFKTMGTFFLLILYYIFILLTIWKLSSGGLLKAFVTLLAHITVVVLFFTPCMFLCMTFPHIINWQIRVHCWLCYHPGLEFCHLYIKEQRRKGSHKKIEQMGTLYQILLIRYDSGVLKLYIHNPFGYLLLDIWNLTWPDLDISSTSLNGFLLFLLSIFSLPSLSWEMRIHHDMSYFIKQNFLVNNI